MIPSKAQLSDFRTLSHTKLLENHTVHSATYLYSLASAAFILSSELQPKISNIKLRPIKTTKRAKTNTQTHTRTTEALKYSDRHQFENCYRHINELNLNFYVII